MTGIYVNENSTPVNLSFFMYFKLNPDKNVPFEFFVQADVALYAGRLSYTMVFEVIYKFWHSILRATKPISYELK